MRTKVAVFMGGRSGEHDISLQSGAAALAQLPKGEFDAFPVVIGRDGAWKIADEEPAPLADGLRSVLRRGVDVAFLAMHGPEGEDGRMQSLFDLVDLPYTGSDPYASSLAMNKPIAKQVYRQHGIPVADDLVLRRDAWLDDSVGVVRTLVERFQAPWVLKTPKLGSSVGLHVLHEKDRLRDVLEELFALDNVVMAEEFVAGRELTGGVLDGKAWGATLALPLVEVTPVDEPYFNFKAKYTVGAAREVCPAPVAPELTARIQRLSVRAHVALGCRGFSRTDFILTEDGRPIALETNTIPGLTETSLLPQAAAEAGICFPDLVAGMVRSAL